MRAVRLLVIAVLLPAWPCAISAQRLTTAGRPAQLDIRVAGDRSIRVTLKPIDVARTSPKLRRSSTGATRRPRSACARWRSLFEAGGGQLRRRGAAPAVDARCQRAGGRLVQELVFETDGTLSFRLDDQPVLGMGEGGPRPAQGPAVARAAGAVRPPRAARHDGAALAERHVRLAQSGRDAARHRAAGGCSSRRRGCRSICASRIAASSCRGSRPPAERAPQNERNQQQALGKGLPPVDADRAGPVRPLRLRRARSGERAEGFLRHHRARGDAAEVGARLHAVASHARGRRRRCSASSTRSARSRSRSTRSSISAPASRRAAGTRSSRRSTSTPTSSSATRRRCSPTCTRVT